MQIFFAIFLSLSFTASAQLCTGTLGDPVVDITFGVDGVTNTGYTPTNAYTFINYECPNDGYYTITKSTANCFGNTWHTVANDHTGSGAFMIINASYAPGDFVKTQVSNLCPNTTYEFAAWLMNLANIDIIDPNISFTIETLSGVVLKKYTTGDIPETAGPEWKQYGFYFTTPPNNPDVILRMTNNAPGGNGNDIAIDDITFRPCTPINVSAKINNNNTLITLCQDDMDIQLFNATVSAGYVTPVYIWQLTTDLGTTWTDIPGANTLTYQRDPTSIGDYWYRITARDQSTADILYCRVESPPVKMKVIAKPIANAGPDKLVVKGNAVALNGLITGNTSGTVTWIPADFINDTRKAETTAYPESDIKYSLVAETPEGCMGQDEVFIKVMPSLYVPSAFSPNNDGVNDRWRIRYLEPGEGTSVQVYNRYGQKVYAAEAVSVDWDGKFNGVAQNASTYIYIIRYYGGKGLVTLKGTVTIIR